MIEYLEPVHPVQYGIHGLDGANSPMRNVTRQVAFGDGWDADRSSKVRDLFDGMAPEWHNRISASRRLPVSDALERGGPLSGRVFELGSGIGDSSQLLQDRIGPTVSVDLAMEMLLRAPSVPPRIRADASRLPFCDGSAGVVVLINALLFPAEIERVLAPDGAVVWVNTSGEHTPIHLSAADLVEALPGRWGGIASRADRGTWAVVRRL